MASTSLRVVESNARRYRHTWRASVFTSFVNPVLLLAAMGLGLGSLVEDGVGGGDLSYLQFLAPGLLAATAMQTAAGESSFPVMAGIKWVKSYEAALATPVTVTNLLAGQVAWAMIRVLQVVVVFALVETAFGAVTLLGGMASIVPALFTGAAFATVITWFTARMENDAMIANLFRFGIVPLFLFSGTFFPISQLPGWLQPLAILTPLWHGVEWARDWALGSEPTWPWWGHAVFLAGVSVVGWVGARRALERRMIR
jgi:lipooligosaccharide transport system permease protein